MKPVIQTLICLALFFISNNLSAQSAMMKGTKVVQAGVGFGGWADTYTSQTPIMSATFMMGIKDDLGPGNLSIGGSVGYKHAEWNAWSYNYTFLTGRAAWHPHFIKSEKIDAYAGISLGIYHLNWDGGGEAFDVELSTTAVAWSLVLGGRYNFTENWGAYAEIGAGLGWLNAGVAYTF